MRVVPHIKVRSWTSRASHLLEKYRGLRQGRHRREVLRLRGRSRLWGRCIVGLWPWRLVRMCLWLVLRLLLLLRQGPVVRI